MSNGQRIALRGALCVALSTVFFAFTFSFPSQKKAPESSNVRKPSVAGGFYPSDKAELERYVDAMLRQANPPEIKAPIRAIIVPHAGYVFSGPVAAYAYKELEDRDIRTVILIGNSHRHYFDGIAVYAKGAFETPLGLVPIDEAFASKLLAADPVFVDNPQVHNEDHVLEVQLPFLQRVMMHKDFKIVPVLFSGDSADLARKMASVLPKLMDDKTVIVASTDMSHYPPYAEASSADKRTLDALLTGKMENFDATLKSLAGEHVPQAETFLCSPSGVRVALLIGQALGDKPVLLDYANSGDVLFGDKNRVVGYGAMAFVTEQKETAPPAKAGFEKKNTVDEKSVNPEEEAELLKLAKSTVESYVRTKKIPPYAPVSGNFEKKLGAFVTLREHGQLRGCIGRFEADLPVYNVVQQMAISAATQDPRFRPVAPEELDKLTYEISILSPLRKITGTDEIVLGKHGVTVSKGLFNHGVFLPQVATETGWNKEEFLSELCSQKAGLPRNCWKDPSVELQVFTAQVFPEEKH